jgi:putative Holliday junction resolvase
MTFPLASVQPAVPAHFQTFLAFDFGLKRTGVATGNRMLRSATPQATIKAEGDARFAQVAQRIKEWQPDALVIGVPYHPDGASHENTEKALKFGRQLRGRFGLQVFEVDERYSTTEACQRSRGGGQWRQGCRRRLGLHHPGTVFEESSMRAAVEGFSAGPPQGKSAPSAAQHTQWQAWGL